MGRIMTDTPHQTPSLTSAPADPPALMPEVLALDGFLPYQLNLLAEQVSRAFSQIYAKQFGIGIPEWRVLAIVGQYGRVTSKEIGQRSTMHKTKVSRAVAALEKRKFVRRRGNPDDMRESFLELLPAGQQIYAELVPQALAFSEHLLAALTLEQRTALADIYDRLLLAADHFDPDAIPRRNGNAGA